MWRNTAPQNQSDMVQAREFFIFGNIDTESGSFKKEWTLSGDFFSFNNEEDFARFQEKLREAFEYVTEAPSVVNYDAYNDED